jgi:hypothetical protein
LNTLEKSIDDQASARMNDQQRRALDQRRIEEFKARYMEKAMQLNNAIAARVGWVDIPDAKPNERDILKAQHWFLETRLGRATLIFGSPRGSRPATEVSNYLAFIADKLPD